MSEPYDRDVQARDRTVIVNNDWARGGGGAGWFVAGAIIILAVMAGLFLFNGGFGGSGGVDVDVNVPAVEVPSVSAPATGGGAAPAAGGTAPAAPAN